jgi:hypothetical protein
MNSTHGNSKKDSAGQKKRMNIIEAVEYLHQAPSFHFIRKEGWKKQISICVDSRGIFYLHIKGIGEVKYSFEVDDFRTLWVKA